MKDLYSGLGPMSVMPTEGELSLISVAQQALPHTVTKCYCGRRGCWCTPVSSNGLVFLVVQSTPKHVYFLCAKIHHTVRSFQHARSLKWFVNPFGVVSQRGKQKCSPNASLCPVPTCFPASGVCVRLFCFFLWCDGSACVLRNSTPITHLLDDWLC